MKITLALQTLKAARPEDRPFPCAADTGSPARPSFQARLDDARDRREGRVARTFEFAEQGLFGARPVSEPLRSETPERPFVTGAEPSAELSGDGSGKVASAPDPSWVKIEQPLQARSAGSLIAPVAGSAFSWQSDPARPQGAPVSMRAAPAESARAATVAFAPRAEGDGISSQIRRTINDGSGSPPVRGPGRAPPREQLGSVRVVLRQGAEGLVVQAFAPGGLTDAAVERLRQRARDMARDHGVTLADLTLNGVSVPAPPTQRST